MGLACAVLFGWRQRGKADPFIGLRLFVNREFSVAAATLAVGIFVLWGSNYAGPVTLASQSVRFGSRSATMEAFAVDGRRGRR